MSFVWVVAVGFLCLLSRPYKVESFVIANNSVVLSEVYNVSTKSVEHYTVSAYDILHVFHILQCILYVFD